VTIELTFSQQNKTLDGFWECRIDYECSWGWKDSHNSVLLSKDFGNSYRGSVFGGELEILYSLGEEFYFEVTGQNGCYRKGKMKRHEFAGREYLSGSWIAEGGGNAMWGTGLCCNGKIELYRDIKKEKQKKDSIPHAKQNESPLKSNVKLQAGKKFVLKNVLFKISSDELLPESTAELELLAALLKENPNLIIRLEGHTDFDGPKRKNKILSKKRVIRVQTFLVSKGINKTRIKLKWYGEKKPITKKGSPEQRVINRRVEVRILKN
ncbi:MAG: OmpA family protein, partial [Bacteroidia bacterium]|nr:OmpA family protein [Bacteroidia bacterium]